MNANKNKNYKLRKEGLNLYAKKDIIENIPVLVDDTLIVTYKDGTNETKNKTTALCMCALSNNRPYCEGAHFKDDFKGLKLLRY